MGRHVIAFLLSAGLLAAPGRAAAGERTSIQGLGMARTYMGVTRGLDAAGINPADLDGDSAAVTVALLPLGIHVGSDFLTYGLYTRYFTGVETGEGRVGRHLTDADKQEILAAFPGGRGSLGAAAEARPISLGVHLGPGSVAFTVTEQASALATVPDAYVRFLLYGNTPGSVYDLSGAGGGAWWTREYALTLAATLPSLWGLDNVSLGVAGKIVHGYGYAELTRCESRLETGADGVLRGRVAVASRSAGIDPVAGPGPSSYTPFPEPAGSGFGVDLGVAVNLSPALRVGMSVTDIGSVTWRRNVREASADTILVVDAPLDGDQRDGVERALRGEEREGGEFTTGLPATIRLGAALELTRIEEVRRVVPGEMTVACDLHQVLTATPGSPAGTRLSLGMEWRPWRFLPVRTGYAFGGPDHRNFALGLGFHLGWFELDLASENLGWLFAPDTFSYGSVSAGMKLRF